MTGDSNQVSTHLLDPTRSVPLRVLRIHIRPSDFHTKMEDLVKLHVYVSNHKDVSKTVMSSISTVTPIVSCLSVF